jgi:glycosyltransferase involved in cell wall biosynthesis
MKILQINTTLNSSSTGKIVNQIGELCIQNGHDSFIVYSGRYPKTTNISVIRRIGNIFDFYFHALVTRFFDKHGFASNRATKKLIKYIDQIKPDIIHLHNLHGYYLNVKILFEYLSSNNSRVVWTLHDCWPFTGHCSHFDFVKCLKWQNACNNCPQINMYPSSLVKDNSKENFENKKLYFTSIDNAKMTIVPVSNWLQTKLNKSFLKDYKSQVIHNGIDLNVFRPIESKIFEKYPSLKNKFILLGVASVWTQRKGFKEFIKLSNYLDHSFIIVLVGVKSKQKKQLPKNIVSIERTSNQEELASLYSAADVYLNLTFEDTYPSTNLEAIACGTPVISYQTGGSPESIMNGNGYVIGQGDMISLVQKIQEIKKNNLEGFSKEFLISSAKNNFNKDINFRKYLSLYNKIFKD